MAAPTPRHTWRLLGDPSIVWDGREVTPLLGKKAIGLVAYLCLARGNVGRDELAALLWPPAEDAKELARAKHNLRQCLVSLRKAFGEAYDILFDDSDDRLGLRPGQVTVDVELLGEVEADGAPDGEGLADLCRGPFLRAHATRSRPFDDWAAEQRSRLIQTAMPILKAAHRTADQAGDHALAARLDDAMNRLGAERVQSPPADLPPGETAATPPAGSRLRWMSHLTAGLVALALGLGGAYGLSRDFRYVARDILFGPTVPHLAVLPFFTQPGTDENIALALKQDVEYGLQKISELIAISLEPEVDYTTLTELTTRARKVGVRYLILGTVRGYGESVEIDVRCFDADTGTIVWSEQYTEDMALGYDLSKRVTIRILDGLDIPITTAEKARIEQLRDTDNMQAWLAAAQGLSHLIRMTHGDIQFAEDYYEDALRYDKDYCSAHRGLAWVSILRVRLVHVDSISDAEQELDKARQHLGACLIDPEQAERGTTKSLQGAILLLNANYDEAVKAGEAAVADLPSSPDTHAIFAHTLTYVGQHERALAEIERAMELSEIDPAWYRWTRGRALRMAGRFDESVKELEQDVGRGQPVPVHLIELAGSYAAAGRLDDARRQARLIKLGRPTWPGADEWLKHPPLSDPEVAAREREYLETAGLGPAASDRR